MIRIAVVGDIGSGKSYIADLFGYPVFNADLEVAKTYKTNKSCFKRLKKNLPKYFSVFPANKIQIIKAIELKKNFPEIEIIKWGDTLDFDIIINATSIGLKEGDEININYQQISKDKFFYDVIYNPPETNFLKNAKKYGGTTTNGKMMFIYQAQKAFFIWHKVVPEVDNETINLLDV